MAETTTTQLTYDHEECCYRDPIGRVILYREEIREPEPEKLQRLCRTRLRCDDGEES